MLQTHYHWNRNQLIIVNIIYYFIEEEKEGDRNPDFIQKIYHQLIYLFIYL